MNHMLNIDQLLATSKEEFGRYDWDGTFAKYLEMVREDPSVSRLSHRLIYDAILEEGVEESAFGDPIYTLFKDKIYGLDEGLRGIVEYFGSASRKLEIRKRILLLLGPPASGKSSVVALIKNALEQYTRTDPGVVYAIKGCPMQEEPLHLIPDQLRKGLREESGIDVEGQLCPRCRYLLATKYKGDIAKMPVERVVFSEQAAVGIGYYIAQNANADDASLLVGSIDENELRGERLEVAGKAFRLDGEFNVANRGLIEFVEIFKADQHLLTTLLGLAQEQLVKMERFGSVYADEAIIAHSNEGDFTKFMEDQFSEALRDRIIAVQVPYNLQVKHEVQIYSKMIAESGLEGVHLPPLTLPTMSVFAILSRLSPPPRGRAIKLLDILRLYDDQIIHRHSQDDVAVLKRRDPNEGMSGISPRYVMNRLSRVANAPDLRCISPLRAINSLFRGLSENIALDEADWKKWMKFVEDTIDEYGKRAISEVQRAFEERFELAANQLLNDYLAEVETYLAGGSVPVRGRRSNQRDMMREIENHARVKDREREKFREDIHQFFSTLKGREVEFDYSAEPRMKAAIESRLFPSQRHLERTLSRPRFARQQVEWQRKRDAIYNRMMQDYGYCDICANDTIDYAVHILRGGRVLRQLKNNEIEWQWTLEPEPPSHIPQSTQPATADTPE
ncbi:MAG: protein prkA [SAR202 cluster bacterium]|jgi:serine protein kinase|nr:protein prkA [SAR202 cluster bacterium]